MTSGKVADPEDVFQRTAPETTAPKPKMPTGKKNCKTCKCPLTLLQLERRRWEHRVVCARCGEANVGTVVSGVGTGGRKKKAVAQSSTSVKSAPPVAPKGASAPRGLLISLAMVRQTREKLFAKQDRESNED